MQPYVQNDSDKCVALCICGNAQGSTASLVSKDHVSFQMSVAKIDKVTGRFNDHFRTCCGKICKSDDFVLRLAKTDGVVSKQFF